MCFLDVFSFLSYSNLFVFSFILLCFILFYIFYSLDTCLFSKERQEGCGYNWEKMREEMEGVGGEETVIRIYSLKKIYFQ